MQPQPYKLPVYRRFEVGDQVIATGYKGLRGRVTGFSRRHDPDPRYQVYMVDFRLQSGEVREIAKTGFDLGLVATAKDYELQLGKARLRLVALAKAKARARR